MVFALGAGQGGQSAEEDRFPYVVSLRNNETNTHFCVGTLVSAQWVLTPAHCLEGDADRLIQSTVLYIGARSTTDVDDDVQVRVCRS